MMKTNERRAKRRGSRFRLFPVNGIQLTTTSFVRTALQIPVEVGKAQTNLSQTSLAFQKMSELIDPSSASMPKTLFSKSYFPSQESPKVSQTPIWQVHLR